MKFSCIGWVRTFADVFLSHSLFYQLHTSALGTPCNYYSLLYKTLLFSSPFEVPCASLLHFPSTLVASSPSTSVLRALGLLYPSQSLTLSQQRDDEDARIASSTRTPPVTRAIFQVQVRRLCPELPSQVYLSATAPHVPPHPSTSASTWSPPLRHPRSRFPSLQATLTVEIAPSCTNCILQAIRNGELAYR